MNLAVSNIAWDADEDEAVAALLRREGIAGIEIAPTKWRADPYAAPSTDVIAFRDRWRALGLEIVSLQALLFGRPELQLFGDRDSRAALGDCLRRAIDFAAAVGARPLVFGSPRNRLRGPLAFDDASKVAAEFFRPLGDYAAERGCALCIEANPPEYGCDFITTTAEAIELCRAIDSPGILANIDLGAIVMAGDDPRAVVFAAASAGVVGHVHASDPNLAELQLSAAHEQAGAALRALRYDRWVSIEMRAAGAGKNLDAIERAIGVAKSAYGRSRTD